MIDSRQHDPEHRLRLHPVGDARSTGRSTATPSSAPACCCQPRRPPGPLADLRRRRNISFTNNVARNTETQESLLFQEGAFSDVVVENNLFDHDSRGYTCQIYQSTGLIFRNNTIVGCHWGCLFRDLPLRPPTPGSGYQVERNVFADTEEGADMSTEGSAGELGHLRLQRLRATAPPAAPHSVRRW